jgi:hypothetical protein
MTNKKNDKTKILDPLNTIIKLAILSYKQPNTKLSIIDHNIKLYEPSYFQGAIRIYNGDNKEDLHYLLNPIYLACKNHLNDKTIELFKLARTGLILLKDTYKNFQTINHTLDLYIFIIDNALNKTDLEFGFVKISPEDIEIYNKFLYKWQDTELNIIVLSFNLIKQTPISSKIHYITSIENILIPIDKAIQDISYI